MNDLGPPPAGNPLVERVKAILLSPKTEWLKIDAEPASIGGLYRSYVMPLAAIGPVAGLIGGQLFGHGFFGIVYRPPLFSALIGAVVGYAAALIGVYVFALVIDALAPQFGATKNQVQAFKLAAYSSTAGWVVGICGLIPALGFLAILALYGLYLLYTGLPVIMKAPADKAGTYTIVIIVVGLVLALLIGAVTAPVMMMFGGGAPAMSGGTMSGSLNVPGGSVDLGKLEAASKKMEDAAKRVQSGDAPPVVAPDVLQGLLPAALPGGMARTSVESSSAGAAGVGGSSAEARYGSGENEITLKVTDMGALGGLATLGGALNVQSSKQTATGYERVGKVEGRMTTEKYDSQSKHGSYSTIVADRVVVEAEGSGTSGDVFKAAVASVDLSKLASLAAKQ